MLLVRHGQSEFNAAFTLTRRDPGIPDPVLTDLGRAQAEAAADALASIDVRRLIASPYTRALQTASIIADRLGLPVEVDPLVRERAAFHCDIGSAPNELAERFPRLSFDHLDHPWWHDHRVLGHGESEESVLDRSARFRARMAERDDRRHVAVITHWGFIRALTGCPLQNGEIVRVEF